MRDAATVVLLREKSGGAEVLLLRRLDAMRFAGGEWVFPGGVVEDADRTERLARSTAPATPAIIAALRARALGEPLDATSALALCIGGCRETFEESGVLLARHRDGRPCSAALIASLQAERSLTNDRESFATLLERHDLVLSADAFIYWSNWITPPISPRRFDTRFFVTQLPAEQDVDARLGEAQAASWLPLRDSALLGGIEPPITSPPTLITLRELADLYERHGSLARTIEMAREMPPISIMLKIVRRDGATEALFPWDESYPDIAGEGVPCTEALRRRLGGYPSRRSVPAPLPKA